FDSEYVGDACQPPCCSLSKLSTSFTFSTPYTTLFRSIDILRANQLRKHIWKIVQEERHYQGKPVDLQKIPQVLKTYETENPFGQDNIPEEIKARAHKGIRCSHCGNFNLDTNLSYISCSCGM